MMKIYGLHQTKHCQWVVRSGNLIDNALKRQYEWLLNWQFQVLWNFPQISGPAFKIPCLAHNASWAYLYNAEIIPMCAQ